MNILKKIAQLFCVVFTVATILSSSLQLLMGRMTDTNEHILDRGVLTLIGALVLILMTQLEFKNKLLRFVVPYSVFISIALLYVFISSFWSNLHPNAYRDVFLNDTIAYIVVYFVIDIVNRIKKKNIHIEN
ncbi:putative membrane protein [[Clostridium] bifermentans ATCC 19299]|uniref:Uncharacterized protein n=1 Tax=Paraclostridium bifermentans TaxID=1490 RepID=A0AA44DND1_PARBF|nr:DUF6608 family protein [Paraclostridium bifermentans]EQK39535.1 putative membrane protein [[Clostridium] bifermentans ATCC 19299] [Paraclostridium bifermentans ATCC 19299]MBN8049127.1 hypothetical protein [Paraclostridium bifermentans]NME10815.1 hypothetical protein [Paraclostridium bifermentans]